MRQIFLGKLVMKTENEKVSWQVTGENIKWEEFFEQVTGETGEWEAFFLASYRWEQKIRNIFMATEWLKQKMGKFSW